MTEKAEASSTPFLVTATEDAPSGRLSTASSQAPATIAFPAFVEFPSIPRLFRDVVVTEKIDGTNASIHISEDGQVLAASRTRYIVPLADNFGFAKWVETHADELREGLGVGQHFGEWYGSGIQRGYGLTNGVKRFALFNVGRWWSPLNDVVVPMSEMKVPPACCEVVPAIGSVAFDSPTIFSHQCALQRPMLTEEWCVDYPAVIRAATAEVATKARGEIPCRVCGESTKGYTVQIRTDDDYLPAVHAGCVGEEEQYD